MGLQELMSNYGEVYQSALLTTWKMTAIAYVGAMVLALAITIMRVCPIRPLRMVGDLYVQVFRNIPGVSLVIFILYALPYLRVIIDWEPGVILAVTLLGSAFGSENFMSGINTIGVGQIEAARSLGMSFFQIQRKVVIPQALRSTVLPMTNLLIAVMLSTALGSLVPMPVDELTGAVAYINTATTTGGIATFAISALGYVLTAVLVGFVGNRIDKKVRIAR